MKKLVIIVLVAFNATTLFSQKVLKQDGFFFILEKLPQTLFTSIPLKKIEKQFYQKEINWKEETNFYDFNQPYFNLEVKSDSTNLPYDTHIDTSNKLLIISELTNKAFYKVFNDSYPYLIGYHYCYTDFIAHTPIKTIFYQLYKTGELIDISDQLFKTLDFCSDNYLDKTLSYFKGTSNEINCDPTNLVFNFTLTDTIWIMDCQYDIMEAHGVDTYFDRELIHDVYIARKYVLKDGKFIPQKR